MFNQKSLEIVRELEVAEYTNAVDLYGADYHSTHEAYAVLKEEVEEAEQELQNIKTMLEETWKAIKKNESITSSLVTLALSAEWLSLEAAQVHAVANKFISTQRKEIQD